MRAALTASCVVMIVLSSAAPAWAAGDAALDHLIVTSPVPGWVPLDAATIERVASTEQRTVSAVTNLSVEVAAEGWHSGRDNVIIILSRFSRDVPGAEANARQAVISACAAATNNPGADVRTYAALPTASEATCSGRSATGVTYSIDTLSWAKRNVFALIVSAGLTSAQVEGIASSQDALIPSDGVLAGSGSNSVIGAALIGAVVALVIGVPIGLFVRSRRQKPVPMFAASSSWTVAPGGDWSVPAQPPPAQSAPAPMAAGWQPVEGDPHRQAYWDGSRWTAQKRWDGTNWIDV